MSDEVVLPSAADMHTHSSVSDGTETPAELIAAAAAAGLRRVALTDHDTTAGWWEAGQAARGLGIELIPGLELSTRVQYLSVHVLGYLVDPNNSALVAQLQQIREGRATRAKGIVARIAVDYDLSWDDVLTQVAGDGTTIGRPHIADALVARGFVVSRAEAFDGILHYRSGYVQPHYAPDPVTGVRLIREAGGVSVLAHPGTRGAERVIPESRLRALVDAGLFGLEIEHPENQSDAKDVLRGLAARYGLAVFGSSDYHGRGKANRLAEFTTPGETVDRVIAAATGYQPIR